MSKQKAEIKLVPVVKGEGPDGQFLLDLDGFDGPIDLMLSLARENKLDLAGVSIMAIAEQYLAYIDRARQIRLELAADYLVMAAWLAWLKSRLLLPPEEQEPDEPPAEEMAEALALQLRRLAAMQKAAAELATRPHLGFDVFARGEVEAVATEIEKVWTLDYFDLLKAYAGIRQRRDAQTLTISATDLWSIEQAVDRLEKLLGTSIPNWTTLESFLPDPGEATLLHRSALAATFVASLQLAKQGGLELKQDGLFSPIFIRKRGS
ncbi:MAG: ScpA family protein [Alphaproteobacteria bacterium]